MPAYDRELLGYRRISDIVLPGRNYRARGMLTANTGRTDKLGRGGLDDELVSLRLNSGRALTRGTNPMPI